MLATVLKSWNLLSRLQKATLTFLAFGRILSNGLDLVGIALIGLVGVLAVNPATQVPFIAVENEEPQTALTLVLGLAATVFVIKTILGLGLFRFTSIYLARVEVQYSAEVSRAVFEGSNPEFRSISQPQVEWMILRSTSMAFTKVLGSAMILLAETTLTVAISVLLFITDWRLAAIATVYFSAIIFFFQLFSYRIVQRSSRELSEGSVDVHDSITSLTRAFKEITVLARTAFFLKRLILARTRVARAEAMDVYLSSIPRLIIELGLILGAVAFVAWQLVLEEGELNLVAVGIFLMASVRIMSAMLPLQRAFHAIRYYGAQAESAQNFLAEIVEKRGKISLSPPLNAEGGPENPATRLNTSGVRIVASGVSFHYQDVPASPPVLTDISFEIEEGSNVAIIGPSGAGKSTLVDAILGLLLPTSGSISCDGMRPDAFRLKYPGEIGYVPQHPGLVSGSIEQNIALGVAPDKIDEAAVWQALQDSNLSKFVEALPAGTKTSLGAHVDSFSGGQLQRLGLARALYTRPRLIVLDEATSALDADSEAAVTESLTRLKGHTTLVVVAHRLSTVKEADVVHVLDGGRIVASGSFQALRKNNSLVKRYVDLMDLQK